MICNYTKCCWLTTSSNIVIVDHKNVKLKGGFEVINNIVASAEYWCHNGNQHTSMYPLVTVVNTHTQTHTSIDLMHMTSQKDAPRVGGQTRHCHVRKHAASGPTPACHTAGPAH